MKRILYICAVLFLLGWIMSAFIFNVGTAGHIFLLVAAILYVQAVMLCPKHPSPKHTIS